MGQYKVPQDVEAEDKIIGPLTIKQFLYTIAGVGCGIATFALGKYFPPIYLLGALPTLLFLALGLWQRQDQPFEALFLALVSFTVKPRKRIWLKEPIADIFRIIAPKPVEEAAPVDPREIMGQLEKLSQVVDTRGWSAKQPELQEPDPLYTSSFHMEPRIGVEGLDQNIFATSAVEIHATDDILDLQNNPQAQELNRLIENSVRDIREEAMARMQAASVAQAANGSDIGQMFSPAPLTAAIVAPTSSIQSMPSDILRQALEVPELKISQLSAQADRYMAIPEGQTISIANITGNNATTV
jgi:PrgI family protein